MTTPSLLASSLAARQQHRWATIGLSTRAYAASKGGGKDGDEQPGLMSKIFGSVVLSG